VLDVDPRPEEVGDLPFEFVTTIRGRAVSCWLDQGELRGDPELLARLSRFSPALPRDNVALSGLVRSAVGSDVAIRVRTEGPVTSSIDR
jgi:hypothetical protein